LLTDSGVTTYTDLFNCWIQAMNRVKISCGQAHIETIVNKLPLSPCDEAALQQAYPHGWDTQNEFENILCVLMFWCHITLLSQKKSHWDMGCSACCTHQDNAWMKAKKKRGCVHRE
jgi:hypothetical protein